MLRVLFLSVLLIGPALLGAGCATLDTRNPVPTVEMALRAEPLDLVDIRAWGDEVPADLAAALRSRLPHMPRPARTAGQEQAVIDILALSGGGTDGAFGAGLLAGWTKRGDRPEFEIVTG